MNVITQGLNSTVNATQNGQSNSARLQNIGLNNTITTSQAGIGNVIDATADAQDSSIEIAQDKYYSLPGNNNYYFVYQNGIKNKIKGTQLGPDNQATVTQEGTNLNVTTYQQGDPQIIKINQVGEFMDVSATQIGYTNESYIDQSVGKQKATSLSMGLGQLQQNRSKRWQQRNWCEPSRRSKPNLPTTNMVASWTQPSNKPVITTLQTLVKMVKIFCSHPYRMAIPTLSTHTKVASIMLQAWTKPVTPTILV